MSYQKGDPIVYQYTHHLNSRATTQIAKAGVFVRYVKVKKATPKGIVPKARVVVKLEGNAGQSNVYETDIRRL